MPDHAKAAAPVRAFWSGTITFGLVSIPVDFYAAARPRQKSMKMVDAEGHPLGRRYASEKSHKPLAADHIVRGYEMDNGKMVVITDEEFAAAAPEMSRDIDLARFVPREQIPPSYFVRPYFLAPTERAGKAYSLLAETMERTGRAGIGRFVMRGHEYLIAILAEGGTLRAETLRFFDELRTPEEVGLPEPKAPPKKELEAMRKEVKRLLEKRLDLHELEDREAEALEELARSKLKQRQDVIELADAESEEEEDDAGGAQIVDLVALLQRSLKGPAKASAPAPASESGSTRRGAGRGGSLAGMSREELYAMATEIDLPGRSKMSKAQLLKALQGPRRKEVSG